MKKIVQKNHPILRQVAKEVAASEINSAKIKGVIRKMKEALEAEPDGVALAAPQIGEALRIFIVSKKVFEATGVKPDKKLVYINPRISRRSKKKIVLEEGCLSVRGLYGKIKRHQKVMAEALDERGRKFSRGGSGLLAEIFQHEIDHLEGILFIDKAWDIKKVPQNI